MRPLGASYQKREGALYQRLVEASPEVTSQLSSVVSKKDDQKAPLVSSAFPSPLSAILPEYEEGSFGPVLMIYGTDVAVIKYRGGIALLDLNTAESCLQQAQLTPSDTGLRAQPLLIPVKLLLNDQEIQAIEDFTVVLQNLGIKLEREGHHARLSAVPAPIRQQNLPQLIPSLLTYLANTADVGVEQIACWLSCHLTTGRQRWSVAQAIQLLADLERLCPLLAQTPPAALLQPIDLQSVLRILQEASKRR